MRQLKCTTSGFSEGLLGKVTFGGVPRRYRGDYFLVTDLARKADVMGYKAVIGSGNVGAAMQHSMPVACIDSDISAFHDGDVVSIEPAVGTVTFEYESQSRDNALLVTERCNCACMMCPQPPRRESETRTAFNSELVRLMAPGPAGLALTGGEPTLLGDDLLVLLSDCKRWLPNTDVIILSNGRRLADRGYVEEIARLCHPRLTIAVALYADVDTLHDEIVGARGAFAETIRGLYNLALYGIQIEVRVVILSLNWQRLPEIADFIYSNFPFASHVALMGLETVGLAARNLERVWVDPFDYREELEGACRYLFRGMIPVSVYNLPLCVLPTAIWPLARKSISGWKNVYLPECGTCRERANCGGFFQSSDLRRSSHIRRVGDLTSGGE